MLIRSLSIFIFVLFINTSINAQGVIDSTTTSNNVIKKKTKPTPDKNIGAIIPADRAVPVTIKRFNVGPKIDGILDEDIWKEATLLKNFFQIRPGDNIAPSKATEVLLGYDTKHFYIAFKAHDDSGKIRATVPKRDQIFDDDYVGFIIDTFNDKQRAYELMFNPIGVQADGIIDVSGREDWSIDIIMESKGTVSKDGYVVEIAIPFKSLRYEAGKGKIWRANFYRRMNWANNEQSSWMPHSRDIDSELSQTGQITGLDNISTERTYELIPSLTMSETGNRVSSFSPPSTNSELPDSGRFVNSPVKFDPGLTMKLNLTPAITLDAAINPDFAQIEADRTVVTANQRFPIFFEERRPFFFEGSDIFKTPLQAVHTRTIVDPNVALKLTGRRGKNIFAVMLASDKAPGNYSEDERNDPEVRPTIEKFIDKEAYVGVLRLKRNFSTDSNIGLIATSYNFIENHNHLGGLDGRIRLSPITTLSFQVLGTNSRMLFNDPYQGKNIFRTGNGLGYNIFLNSNGRHFGYEIGTSGRTKYYKANLGFTRRTNNSDAVVFTRYASEPKPKATLISWRLSQVAVSNFDFQGRLQNFIWEPFFRMQFKRQTFAGLGFVSKHERIFEEEFGAARTATQSGNFYGSDSERSTHNKEIFGFVESSAWKKISFEVEGAYGYNEFDYDFGAGKRFPRVSPIALRVSSIPLIDPNAPKPPNPPMDPGPGNSFNLSVEATFRPTNALNSSIHYRKSKLHRNDTNRTAYNDNIYSWRTTYQFTRFLFARARLDYSSLNYNVRSQYLFGWTPNPRTSFYIGYNDNFNYNGFSPLNERYEPGFKINNRTFFIKMSYLIRRSI